MTNIGVSIIGSGSAIPKTSLDNQQLSQIVETSDEWIISRTGINKRQLVDTTESLCSLATQASLAALNQANITPKDIDLIILATSTPDDLFGTACKIQWELGAQKAVAFDITVACSGFLFALVTGAQFIRNGVYQNVLLIGADILSRWVDWEDRRTCVLFGDGAGAVLLQASESDRLLGFELGSDGSQNSCLSLSYQPQEKRIIEGVTVSQGTYQPIAMNGKEVYRFVVQKVPEAIEKALLKANIDIDKLDWLLLHQANQRILDAVANRLNIPPEKVISNLRNYGNTSAASIPLALDEVVREGLVKSGDIIAASGFGAGLSWGAVIFQWN